MGKPDMPALPAVLLDQYDRLVATQAGVERKGASLPYTSVNGHMFSFLAQPGVLALRLSAADRATFIEQYGTSLHEAHGTVMKEYVTVPGTLMAETGQLAPWFAASLAYVSSLKPKPTRRGGGIS